MRWGKQKLALRRRRVGFANVDDSLLQRSTRVEGSGEEAERKEANGTPRTGLVLVVELCMHIVRRRQRIERKEKEEKKKVGLVVVAHGRLPLFYSRPPSFPYRGHSQTGELRSSRLAIVQELRILLHHAPAQLHHP